MTDAGRVSLATTALEEFWDTSVLVVFLAPWCLRYSRRQAWEPLGGMLVPDPWAASGALATAETDVERRHEASLAALGAAIDARLGEGHSERYWRIVLGPWLMAYVPALYDLYARVSAALESYPGLTSVVLDPSCEVVPHDTLEAVQLLKDDAYNLQLCSRLLRELGVAVRTREQRVDAPPFPFGVRRAFARTLSDGVSRADVALRAGRVVMLKNAYFPPAVLPRLTAMTLGRAVPGPASPVVPPTAPDPAARASLVLPPIGDDDFGHLLAAWLPKDLPTGLLEGRRAVSEAAERFGRAPRWVMSANAWYYDEPFKQWAAEAAESGTALLGTQHGGNYGIDARNFSEDHETIIADVYYTWGWERAGRPAQVTPMPATKLIGRPTIGASGEKDGILFVSTTLPRYPMQFPHTPERFEAYLALQQRFAAALDAHALAALRLRPHREDGGWDVAERWRDAHPEVQIESWDVPFAESLQSCRICVIDHLSTTFAEALAADKPTILFWPPEAFPERPEARTLMDGLRRAGILFDSPEEAAEAAGSAYAHVAAWWKRPERRAAVSAFCERFARTSPDALELWTRELDRVLREGRGA